MSPKTKVWIFSGAVLVLLASVYFSSQKMKHDEPAPEKVVDKPVVVEAPKVEPLVTDKKVPFVPPSANCKAIPEFNQTKSELGRLVNQHELRQNNFPQFLKQINEFRIQKGLPLPMVVDGTKMGKEGVVYNNCRPSCKGSVNQVFVTRLIGGRNIEVLTQTGDLKTFPTHDSGIEAITVDELSGKGIPFRSWMVPVIDSGWFISGSYLYYPLDIEGVWLQADTRGNWNFVAKPSDLKKLEEVEPAVKFAGCTPDDHCFTIAGSGTGAEVRHFKAPRACEPILRHSQDEPVEDNPVTPPKSGVVSDGASGNAPGTQGPGNATQDGGRLQGQPKSKPPPPPTAGGAGGEL